MPTTGSVMSPTFMRSMSTAVVGESPASTPTTIRDARSSNPSADTSMQASASTGVVTSTPSPSAYGDLRMATSLLATTGAMTDPSATTTAGTATPPSFNQTQANWQQNLANALQMYQAQVQMDHDQQAMQFASQVEAKGNQMIMACIQNIR
jgi:hypothetical protein